MYKRLLLVTILLLPGYLFAGSSRPNIILILADDLGWGNIGCFGGPIETPNLDRMAADGARFSQFYTYPRCCPARAMLMTGLHPHEVGVGHMTFRRRGKNPSVMEDRMKVPPAYRGWVRGTIPTLPEMLRSAGYGTYMAGKWHIGNNDTATWPTSRGFDKFYGFLDGTSEYYKPADLIRDTRKIQPEGERYYTTDAFTREAMGYIDGHLREKPNSPFFLYLAFNAPHFPMQAMPEDYAKYRGKFKAGWDVIREQTLERQKAMGLLPSNAVLSPRSGDMRRLGTQPGAVPAWEDIDAAQKDAMDAIMATYAAMVDRLDQNIGRLINHLRNTDQLDNTIICFLSDNGAEAESPPLGEFDAAKLGQYDMEGPHYYYGRAWANVSNTPFREFKHFTYQGGVMSPLIIRWPKGTSPKVRGGFVREFTFLADIVETCLDYGGASRPAIIEGKPTPKMDGQSLRELLAGKKVASREPVCIEHEGNRLVREGKWKLVSYFEKQWELYDLESDPTEQRNLALENVDTTKRLAAAYDSWADRVGVIPWRVAQNYSVYPPDSRHGLRQ